MMAKVNLNNSNLVVLTSSSIQEAMERITDNQRGAVTVIDEELVLRGVVSDGDIRRAMLRGATMVTPVDKILNPNPVSLTPAEAKVGRALEIFTHEPSINILPVIDNHNKLLEVLIRNPEHRKEL